MNTIRIRLGHESLACLKGGDAESEEAQEHANSSSLALWALTVQNDSATLSDNV